MFKRKKQVFISKTDMDDLLKEVREHRYIFFSEYADEPLKFVAYVDDTISYLKVTTNWINGPATYVFRKDGEDADQQITGLDAYIELAKEYSRVVGEPFHTILDEVGSARALLSYRIDTDNTRVNAYGYDMRNAYGWALKQPLPDTREVVGQYRDVEDGEIGFIVGEQAIIPGMTYKAGSVLTMCEPGEIAEIIFKTMPSPFSAYVDRWYSRKENSTDPAERAKAKQMVNFAVGYLQRKNPYIRCAVVEYCNRRIRSFIDENTIYCNTDSIISKTPRPDLPSGPEIGSFRLEHENEPFAHRGFNYQWGDAAPSMRRIPKSWFKKGFDILTDTIPDCNNTWEFDPENIILKEYIDGKESDKGIRSSEEVGF